MDILNITTYLANCINEIWKREVMNYDIQEENYEQIIEEFFQKCCNSDNTTYNGISYYNYKIDNIYECINYLNKKNNEIYGEDIPVYYLLNEDNIKKAIIYFVGLKWRYNKLNYTPSFMDYEYLKEE